jgi:hypothetical protein
VFLLSLVVTYAFATTVLGDGLVSFGHHFHLGEVALCALVVVTGLVATTAFLSRLKASVGSRWPVDRS